MFEFSILENPERSLWDSFLATNSLGNLWQTIDFGEFTRRLNPHGRTSRLVAMRDCVPEGIVQGIFSKYLGFGTVMTIQEGPILSITSRDKPGLLKSLVTALENFAVKNRILRIEIQWPYKWGNAILFEHMGYEHVKTNITYTINLCGGEEDLWRRIEGNKRRNIKKAIARGVEIMETSSFEDIEKFYELFIDTARRRKEKTVLAPLLWFQTLWKSRNQKDSSRLFFARWGNRDLSCVFVTMHARTIYALGWGYLSTDLEVRPNDLLHWKIMGWGCKQGFLRYQMGEVRPEDPSLSGIWRWKREWNGDLDPVYTFRKSISKSGLIERIYDFLKKQKLGI